MKTIITNEMIETYFKSLNDSQSSLLGVNRKKRGWKKRLIGKSIKTEDLKEAIAIKGFSIKQRKERLNTKLGIIEEPKPRASNKNDVFIISNFTNRNKILLSDVVEYFVKINSIKPSKKVHSKLKEFIRYYNRFSNSIECCDSSNVYLISDNNGSYKIGKSNDVYKRLKALQTGTNNNLSIVKFIPVRFSFKIEKFLHDMFYSHRNNGEWFSLESDQLLSVISIMKRLDEKDILIERVL